MSDYSRSKQRALETKNDLPSHLICRECKESKPNSEFDDRISNIYGKHTKCRPCKRLKEKIYYSQNKMRQEKKYYDNILNKYGLTKEDFLRLLESQNTQCAICSIRIDGSTYSQKPRIDHNHDTGKVRGLLCGQCNVGIGHFYENQKFLLNAIEYLGKYNNG